MKGNDMKFIDISTEQYRQYTFVGGEVVRIAAPMELNVSAGGGHRILDAAGVSHYVPTGWLHLCWEVKPGSPAFVA